MDITLSLTTALIICGTILLICYSVGFVMGVWAERRYRKNIIQTYEDTING